jgi:hypothetical protein
VPPLFANRPQLEKGKTTVLSSKTFAVSGIGSANIKLEKILPKKSR